MTLPFVKTISWDDQPLAYIIRTNPLLDRMTFLTPPEFKQQAGFVVYPKGGSIQRHTHLLL